MIIENVGNFSVSKTFDCGQCFRFDPVPGEEECFEGVAYGNYARFRRTDGGLEITGGGDEAFWRRFLSLDEDYGAIDAKIRTSLDGERDRAFMNSAVDHGAGIRILRQDPWETLISFIISQNNNIPRIKKIIAALCERYGEDIGGGRHSFPTPEAILGAGEQGLSELRCGFRAPYIYDAARRAVSGETDLEKISALRQYGDADAELRKIKGVGPKVSACVLLFGFGRKDAFPIDVWMKRIMEKRFPDGLDYRRFGEYAGVAQQYLFYYERWLGGGD